MANDLESLFTNPRTIHVVAEVVHEQWAHWQRYLHGECERLPDGSLIMPADLVARWERQIATPFAELPSREQDSDRELAERYIRALRHIAS
ncbi:MULTISPECIES: hypothetical protein [unclassified Microbacterium]|uniref:hypothetical protein n=1 Tax=unclassified Microbacterium TaxID=2609290 RepID=UPI00344305A0